MRAHVVRSRLDDALDNDAGMQPKGRRAKLVRLDEWAKLSLAEIPRDTLLNISQVSHRFGDASMMAFWRWQRDETIRFPMHDAVIAGRRFWLAGSLADFLDRLLARKEAETAPATNVDRLGDFVNRPVGTQGRADPPRPSTEHQASR
jgi:hypothetical protein